MRQLHVLRFLVFPLMLLLIVASCSSSAEDDAPPEPEEVLDQALDTFQETDSARFDLEIDGTIALGGEGELELGAVEGAIARPASAQAEANVQFMGSSITMELIASDGTLYLRNPLSGEWENAPTDLNFDPALIFDEDTGISRIVDQLENLENEGEDSVNGTDTWHITATIDTSEVQGLTGSFFEGDILDLDMWIATDDHRLMRVELHDSEAAEPSSWVLTLSDHNEPVDISPPEMN